MTADAEYEAALADLADLMGEPAPAAPTPVPDPHGWDDEEEDDTEGVDQEEQPELYYGSVDEFVREVILPMYQRKVGPRGHRRWASQWWRSAEAVSRLDSLWRSWEHLRQDGATGMSSWWRDHADYHMERLFDPDGPFGASQEANKPGDPLPYEAPPPGLFTDARTEATS
ncbi:MULTISPECIES: DUF4913 domain-containing protein [unclassified Nocardiopsis]|uniref:DUF4913 domain-containing protein n=1 Tax=unclassified Nocardiopsis TaxID=2649073 RepID=UPI001F1E9D5C|nr:MULTISPECIES: DUF4913 domain-containing protein [unclassified Nocardiopsis]